MSRFTIAMVCAVACMAGASVVRAEEAETAGEGGEADPARDQARELFFRAMELVESEHWEEALEAFDESLRLYPTQAALFNRGLCLGLLGRPAQAVQILEAHLRQYGDDIGAEQRAEVERVLATNRGRVGHIEVTATGPESAQVLLDGTQAGQTPMAAALDVNPGRHQLTLRADGFDAEDRWVEVGAGETVTVEIALEEEHLPGLPGGGPTRHRGMWIGAWVSTGIAVAALGAALGLYLWNDSQFDTWETEYSALREDYGAVTTVPLDHEELGRRADDNEELRSTIDAVDAVSWVLMGTGTAAAVAAVVLFILSPRMGGADSGVALVPQPGGLALTGAWHTW